MKVKTEIPKGQIACVEVCRKINDKFHDENDMRPYNEETDKHQPGFTYLRGRLKERMGKLQGVKF